MRFPKIDDVAAELRDINKYDLEPEDADEGIDVRLQVYPDGQWAVRWGLSDYDQDHRGYWGASSVPGNNRRFNSKDIARDLIDQAKDAFAEGAGFEEAPAQPRVRSRRQPSLPGFPDIPEKPEIRIPNMPIWEQIGGDMDIAGHGGTLARSDGDALEVLKIQPVREYVGGEAAEVGFPFWTREAWFDLEDLDPDREDVKGALQFIGMTLDELGEEPGGRKAAGERGYTPQQRALIIAEALVDYGVADEGPAGWSDDIYPDAEVKDYRGDVTTLGALLAGEDDEFATDVLLADLERTTSSRLTCCSPISTSTTSPTALTRTSLRAASPCASRDRTSRSPNGPTSKPPRAKSNPKASRCRNDTPTRPCGGCSILPLSIEGSIQGTRESR
jgi:hypothetical protein